MFRFWASDYRGSDQTLEELSPIAELIKPHHPTGLEDHSATIASFPDSQPPKRRRLSDDSTDESLDAHEPAKHLKTQQATPDASPVACDEMAHSVPATSSTDVARDKIQHHLGLEILLKHDELRLINQELAKCQVALEQLRRCHLIPYPVNCPTPEQMLNISAGKGPALQSRPGERVPRWAPPFGVVDGPYARHYAKWLIPDPSFDGIQPEWEFTPEAARARASFAEGRTTRNSFTESVGAPKGRPARGMTGQKLQALSSGYPQPKEKAGPCVLKRSDGQTVKLVCIDCNRENFSSTQGFINHCRIAHKRDFKSHEEAAVQSGHPIEVSEGGGIVGEEKPPATPSTSTSTAVHPFVRHDLTEQEAYVALRSRISESLKLFHQGKLPGVTRIPCLSDARKPVDVIKDQKSSSLTGAAETPYLSRLMQSRNFHGNLRELVADAKTKVSFEDITPGEELEVGESFTTHLSNAKGAAAARTHVVKRVPARVAQSPPPSETHPISRKGRAPPSSFVTPPNSTIGTGGKHSPTAMLSDEDMEMEDVQLSPTTLAGNIAPSLVSDDDDSDDGFSVSGVSDNMETESVSDVAEINLDDEQDPRSLRRGSSGTSGAVRLRKDEAKHVTFMSPVKPGAKDRRPHRV